MQDSEKPQFAGFISGVYAFYRQDSSPFAIKVWWETMKQYDFAAVSEAINRHCVNPDSGQFMPKPADVVKLMSGTTKDTALMAWAKVDKAVRQVGTHASVVFDDPIIHCVVQDMGGWIELGRKKEDEWPFVAKEFENRYRGYRNQGGTHEFPARLIGIAEAQNGQNGFQSQQPVLIGSQEQAQKVLLGGSDVARIGIHRAETAGQKLAANRAIAIGGKA